MKKKVKFWKFLSDLKGVAIIGVVASHVIVRMIISTLGCIGYSPRVTFLMYFHQLMSFSVPLFFFFSGYYLLGIPKTGKSVFNNVIKLIIPYFFWCIIFLFYKFLNGNEISVLYSIKKIFMGQLSIFWFLYILIQYYILSGVICFFFNKDNDLSLLIALIINVCISIINYTIVFKLNKSQLSDINVYPVSYIPNFCFYIIFGMWFRKKTRYIKEIFDHKIFLPILLGILLVSVFFLIVETDILFSKAIVNDHSVSLNYILFAFSQWKFSQLFYSIAVILLLLFIGQRGAFNKFTIPKKLGTKTFSIYLMHIFFIDFLNFIMIRLNIIFTYNIVGFIIYLVALIGIPLLIRYLYKLIFPPSFLILLGE